MLPASLGVRIALAFWLAVSLASTRRIVEQGAAVRPRQLVQAQPTRRQSSFAPQFPNSNTSLPLIKNLTGSAQFHIPGTDITLSFTTFGRPLNFVTVFQILDLALEGTKTIATLHPSRSITDGFFRQEHDGLEIKIHEYLGSRITWRLLRTLLLGMQYYAFQHSGCNEQRFEIYVEGKGRVGFGSLWHTGPEGSTVAKRSVKKIIPSRSRQSISWDQ